MKRLFWAIFTGFAILCALSFSAPAFAISDEEQNAGFVHFDTAVYTVRPDAITYIYRVAPASDTTWLANHPDCQYIVLPKDCRGFELRAYGNDIVINHPENLATGDVIVGRKVASGDVLVWDHLDLEQRTINFGMLSNGTDNATATFCGW